MFIKPIIISHLLLITLSETLNHLNYLTLCSAWGHTFKKKSIASKFLPLSNFLPFFYISIHYFKKWMGFKVGHFQYSAVAFCIPVSQFI
jgi:hypothetical protein